MDICEFIIQERDTIFERWEKAACEQVPAAKEANRLALRDHLPYVVEDVIQALELLPEVGDPRLAADQAFDGQPSEQHGRQRASTVGYTVEQVLHEICLLRRAFVDTLREGGFLDPDGVEAITVVLERGALYSVKEFLDSLEEVQQKLVGTLAHDIRTPLAVAKTAMSLLKANKDDPNFDSSGQVKTMATQSVDRALGMLSGLLDSISAEAGDGLLLDFENGDFGDEVWQACEEAKHTYGDNLVEACPRVSIHGCFDHGAFRRIFENLVSNAVRHGSPTEPVRVVLEEAGDTVVLSVNNAGEPIPEERREEIFEFLSRNTTPAKRGNRTWGIGLSFVKLAADGHGGEVTLTSDEANGTTFFVRFPKFAFKPGKRCVRVMGE